MKSYHNNKTLIFYHIPKTAGTSLSLVLSGMVPLGTMGFSYGFEHRRRIQDLPEQIKRTFRLFVGHQAAGLHTHLPQNTIGYTIVREPVSRYLSLYYHLVRKNIEPYTSTRFSDFLYRLRNDPDATLPQFSHMLANRQILCLDPEFISHQLQGRDALTYAPKLENAKRFVNKQCIAVGIHERLDDSLLVLGQTMGWPHLYTIRTNTAPQSYQPELSPQERGFLEDFLALEFELYDYVEAKMEEQFAHLNVDSPDYLRPGGAFTTVRSYLRYIVQRQLYKVRVAIG